jgi:hypothetical protein
MYTKPDPDIAVEVPPSQQPSFMNSFKSRKFLGFVLVVLAAFAQEFGLVEPALVDSLLKIAIGYGVIEGSADLITRAKQ